MLSYFLLESGSAILIEDGTELELEESVAGGVVVDPVVVASGGAGRAWVNGVRQKYGPRVQIHRERPVFAPERKAEKRVARTVAAEQEAQARARRLAEEVARRQKDLETTLDAQARRAKEKELAAITAEAMEAARAQALSWAALQRAVDASQARTLDAERVWALRMEEQRAELKAALREARLREDDEAMAIILVAVASNRPF